MDEDNVSNIETAREKRKEDITNTIIEYTEQEAVIDTLSYALTSAVAIYEGDTSAIEIEDGELEMTPTATYILMCGEDGEYVNFSSGITTDHILDMIKILTQSLQMSLGEDT